MSVSIKEVASRAGVSISTVSRVINGSKKVSPLLKVKVERAISETNYSTNRTENFQDKKYRSHYNGYFQNVFYGCAGRNQ